MVRLDHALGPCVALMAEIERRVRGGSGGDAQRGGWGEGSGEALGEVGGESQREALDRKSVV